MNAQRRFDVVVAAVIVALTLIGVWAEITGWPRSFAFPVGGYLIGAAAGAALVFRRDRPFVCTLVVLGLVALYHFVGYPGGAPALALFVALYSLAAYARTAWWIIIAIMLVGVWQVIPSVPPNAVPWTSYATTGPAMGMLWVIAIGVGARQIRRSHARELRAAEATANARLTEKLTEERLGLAHDVHDILAHTISAIAVQSAAALDAFDSGDSERARGSITRVRALAKDAMPELHRTLVLLRQDTDRSDGSLVPQPSLANIRQALEPARQAGLSVTADLPDETPSVGPVVGLTIYRIVQEALTNVLRHSSASEVQVSVWIKDGSVVAEVLDNGTGGASLSAPADGFGIRGMRERAAAVGGALDAGPHEAGGFAVRAVLPLTGEQP